MLKAPPAVEKSLRDESSLCILYFKEKPRLSVVNELMIKKHVYFTDGIFSWWKKEADMFALGLNYHRNNDIRENPW